MSHSARSRSSAAFAACALAAGALLAGPADASVIDPGLYRLGNHPDGNAREPGYGLRLDELFDVNPGAHDVFTFDFEEAGSDMFLSYDGSSVHIFGTAFGGLDTGSEYDPAHSSLVAIDFLFSAIAMASGDDDLVSTGDDTSHTGTLTWLETGEEISLFSFSGSHSWAFRFGDENDDQGHRGFDGLSGWGWLSYREPGLRVSASDWLFTGELVPAPGALAFLGLGLLGYGRRRPA